MDDDDREQGSFERLLDITGQALPYLIVGVLVGKFLAIFAAGAAFEPVVVRMAACIALAIMTALAIDQAAIRFHGGRPDHKDVSTS